MSPLIKTQNLTKIYQLDSVQIPALREISLKINRGEFVSITGPSGSGKSTLLNLLGCLDTPTRGTYFLEGIEIKKGVNLAQIRREKIGFIFQTFNLLVRLSALENVEIPMIYKGIREGKRKEKAQELLESVGLGERIDHQPTQLSGGEQQRVAIARALANEPSLILADEPTGNVDTKIGWEILTILKELNKQGTTIILVTHEENLAREAERTIKLVDGRIERELKSQNAKLKATT